MRALHDRFTPHEVSKTQECDMRQLRLLCFDAADFITEHCPPCRETSLALTKLEEATFWANAAIARGEEKA